jgi:hypothetical protein
MRQGLAERLELVGDERFAPRKTAAVSTPRLPHNAARARAAHAATMMEVLRGAFDERLG